MDIKNLSINISERMSQQRNQNQQREKLFQLKVNLIHVTIKTLHLRQTNTNTVLCNVENATLFDGKYISPTMQPKQVRKPRTKHH